MSDKTKSFLDECNLELGERELEILGREKSDVEKRILSTILLFAKFMKAEKLVEIQGSGHFSMGDCTPGLGPDIETLRLFNEKDLQTRFKYTVDPAAPLDFENLFLQEGQIQEIEDAYKNQPEYSDRMLKTGHRDSEAWTCTPYFKEVGNVPQKDQILAWSESSCVIYANSILGARTNRNGAGFDLLQNLMGVTPYFGLLTDEGRKADWLIELKTDDLPEPQLLGAAIGMTVGEDTPFIAGLDKFFDSQLSIKARDYLKNFGAACAAIGAVGLYHIEGITPEALDQERGLLKEGYRTLTIDDDMLKGLKSGYKNLWIEKEAQPQKCMVGCPHLSREELDYWIDELSSRLERNNMTKLKVSTIFFAAPAIIKEFMNDSMRYKKLLNMGARLSPTCPEAIMNMESISVERVITNSNKLRDISSARFFESYEIMDILTGQKECE